jgi:hypothetical protein
MRENKADLFELIELEAEFKRNKFNFLTSNGFTDEQALELCKGNSLLI